MTFDTIIPTQIDTIIHISDIHIRLYKRHDEYRNVFEKLYSDIKSKNFTNVVIVLTGDIVHAKIDLSPELVQLVSEFLCKLSDIHPLIVIPGNHDCLLANSNRLDSLSPIINNLKSDRILYFKNSGTKILGGIQFSHLSVLDDSSKWPDVKLLDQELPRVALYHGPLNSSFTDLNFEIESPNTVSMFDGYDMVLLGDIHSPQLLQEYTHPGVPEIFYVGSLIQQNHSENLQGHGYAIWDVSTRKVIEFVEIPNEYGYCTVQLNGSELSDYSTFPSKIRVRIIAKNSSYALIKKAQATLRSKFDVIESIVHRDPDSILPSPYDAEFSDTKAISNIRDISNLDHQVSLILSYMENVLMMDMESPIINKVLEVHSKLYHMIEMDNLPPQLTWKPIQLKFDNLFSYGENNIIDFTNMSGLMGIFSENATGKTSAVAALCFALYDKTPTAFKGNHIMNVTKDTCLCEFTFEIDEISYVIERIGTRKKNGDVKMDVRFWKINSSTGEREYLTKEDRRETNAQIRSYVGSYEDFILTTFSVQGQNSLFIETGQTDRKDLLIQFMGLTIFDRLSTLAQSEIKEVSGALRGFGNNDFSDKLVEYQNNIQLSQNELIELRKQETDAKEEIEQLFTKINELYGRKIPVQDMGDVSKCERQLTKNQIELKKLISNREISKQQWDQYTSIKNEISSELISIGELAELEAARNVYEISREELDELEKTIVQLETQLDEMDKKLEKLDKHKYDPSCNYCMNNIFVKDAISTRELRTNSGIRYKKLKELRDVKNDEVINYKIGYDKYSQWQKTIKKLSETDGHISLTTNAIAHLSNSITILEKENVSLQNKLELYEKYKHDIAFNMKLDNEIEECNIEKKTLAKTLETIQKNISMVDKCITVLQNQKEILLDSIESAKNLQLMYDAYELYENVVGRDGIPYQLIGEIIPVLEHKVNDLLSNITQFTISFELDGKYINAYLVYNHEDSSSRWPLELGSGMERFVAGLTIRTAMIEISNLPKTTFLVVDEGFGVLDSTNISHLSVLFDIMKEQFDFIILISHLPIVRDVVDSLIDIQKSSSGYSSIYYTK